MINLAFAEFLFTLILLIAAYFISHTINGYIQAYVCAQLGDDTAKESGYMSLSPLDHIDVVGFLLLIFLGIGWLQTVPIDPYAFIGRCRYVRLLAAYATEACVSTVVAILSLFLCVLFYGYSLTVLLVVKLFTFYIKPFMILFSSSHLNIAALFTEHQSPLAIALAFLLVSLVYLNIWIATISLIWNSFRYMLVVGFERGYAYVEYADYLSFFGPFLVLIFFGDRLRYFLLQLTDWGAWHIAHLFGVL